MVEVNNKLAELLGYSPAELFGVHCSSLVHSNDANTGLLSSQAGLAFSQTKQFLTKRGAGIWCQTWCCPISYEGKVKVWLKMVMPLDESDTIEDLRKEFDAKAAALQTAVEDAKGDLRALIGRDVDVRIGDNIGGDKTGRDKTTSAVPAWMVLGVVLAIVSAFGVKIASEWFTAEPVKIEQVQHD